MKVTVSKVDNGYVVDESNGVLDNTLVFRTLDEVLQELLTHFENRYPGISGNSHGEVKVLR